MLVAVISLPRKISAGMAVQGGPRNVDYDGSTCLEDKESHHSALRVQNYGRLALGVISRDCRS